MTRTCHFPSPGSSESRSDTSRVAARLAVFCVWLVSPSLSFCHHEFGVREILPWEGWWSFHFLPESFHSDVWEWSTLLVAGLDLISFGCF